MECVDDLAVVSAEHGRLLARVIAHMMHTRRITSLDLASILTRWHEILRCSGERRCRSLINIGAALLLKLVVHKSVLVKLARRLLLVVTTLLVMAVAVVLSLLMHLRNNDVVQTCFKLRDVARWLVISIVAFLRVTQLLFKLLAASNQW